MRTLDVKVDLRGQFGPARDQGARPTCLAFAASDSHAGLRDGWVPLSSEFAFYQAQRRAGRTPAQGAILPSMLEALKLDGQPVETGWPYLAKVPTDVSAWVPPASVGARFGRNGIAGGADLVGVRSMLSLARPMLLLTMLSMSFFAPVAGVVDVAPGEIADPRCLVPAIDGALSAQAWKDALWDRFYTGAPGRQRQSVERYNIVKRA